MPLVKTTLNNAIDSSIKSGLVPLIEAKTKVAFEKGLLKFQSELKTVKKVDDINKAITSASIEFSIEMRKLGEDISKTVAKAVSDSVDTYIKAGTVNVLVNGVTVGAPSPQAIIAQPGVGSII